MSLILVALLVVPPLTIALCAAAPGRVAESATIVTGVAALIGAIALVPAVADSDVTAGTYLRVDGLSEVFLLSAAFVYACTAAYAVGSRANESRQASSDPGKASQVGGYDRRFYVGLNAFAWSMIAAPLMSGLATLWIAIEITTVVSALLVALDRTDRAAEAAWKYVLLASCGLGIALLATVIMYYAGSQSLGQSYDLAFDPLLAAAHAGQLAATAVRLAFVLAVVGYGTKVGLFPMHTWLPDAHAEAPTPVSALLSGSLLAVSFYAILRYFQVTAVALGGPFPQRILLVFGGLSLLLAAAAVLVQRDLKRLLAYSSVEHMGILAVGVGFGAPVAVAGVLLHVLAHAAAKGNAFMGAGVIVRKFGAKELSGIHDAVRVLPWSGPLFLASLLALGAMPPFGMFRSEFQIVSGAVQGGRGIAGGILVILVTTAFIGLTAATTRILFTPQTADVPHVAVGEPHPLMVVPVVVGIVALVVLGVHPPSALIDVIGRGVAALQGVA